MCSENECDRLSSLPDEITSHILSLMPTKYAVRTSILSKRWRNCWMFVTNLDIDEEIHDLVSFCESMDQIMESCKSSQLKLFRLHLSDILLSPSSVSEWINEAVRLQVHELDIKVFELNLPVSMFTCKTLTKLRLYHGDTYFPYDWGSFDSANLPCLKTLDLGVDNGDHFHVFKLIHGCPMLESLFMTVEWRVDQEEEDYIFKIPTLKRLKLILPDDMENKGFYKVFLHVPNVEYLFVDGAVCSLFVNEDFLSLVEAFVSFDYLCIDNWWVELLKRLSGVQSLALRNISSDIVFGNPFVSSLPIFPYMTSLELKGRWDPPLITRFLESSPKLKHFCIDELEEMPWIEPDLVPACLLTNLTTFEFKTNEGKKCDMKFLEYVLGNAKVLKTTTITLRTLLSEKERVVSQVLELPRASKYCEFHVM